MRAHAPGMQALWNVPPDVPLFFTRPYKFASTQEVGRDNFREGRAERRQTHRIGF